MSYTLKVILISLGIWLGLSLAVAALDGISGAGFSDTFLIGGLVIGLIGAAALFITAIVIFIAKLDGKKRDQPANPDVLDGKPEKLSYQTRGLAFLAAAGVILLVGTSVCFGMFTV